MTTYLDQDQISGSGSSRGPRDDPLCEPCEPAPEELGVLRSQVPGHRWAGWRRLTGGEDYYAACSCGWRSTDTGGASPMLGQVKDHLDAVRAVRGRDPAARTARAPGRAGHEGDIGQRMARDERARELYAAVQGQQRRLLGRCT